MITEVVRSDALKERTPGNEAMPVPGIQLRVSKAFWQQPEFSATRCQPDARQIILRVVRRGPAKVMPWWVRHASLVVHSYANLREKRWLPIELRLSERIVKFNGDATRVARQFGVDTRES